MNLWCRVQEGQATRGQGRASGQESAVTGPDALQAVSGGRAGQGRGGRCCRPDHLLCCRLWTPGWVWYSTGC